MSKYFEQMQEEGKSIADIIPLTWKTYLQLLNEIKDETEVPGIKSHLPLLNHLNGGFDDGRLYVLGAPPKQGKTALAMSLMYGMAKQGVKSLFFSYEVEWKTVVKTFREMERVDGTDMTDLPINIPIALHRGGDKLQLQWLREACEKAKAEGIGFVTIDYLHFLIPYQVTQNFSIVVGNVVREIKRIAIDVGLPILLIVAMKKVDGNKPPSVWDIRDSSMIMHEADDIMIMYRLKLSEAEAMTTLGKKNKRPSEIDNKHEDPYVNISVLKLEMSRKSGSSGTVFLSHNGAYFTQIDKGNIADQLAYEQATRNN